MTTVNGDVHEVEFNGNENNNNNEHEKNTNKWEKVPSVMHIDANHKSTDTDNEQEENNQSPAEQYQQNKLSTSSRSFYRSKPKYNKNHSESTTTIGNNNENKTQQKKTPITVLNEWAMRHYGYGHKKKYVSYECVSMSGELHRPVFTFMCKMHDKMATAVGYSKREAKQNSAAKLWKQLFDVNSDANSSQHPTSTTNSDIFEASECNTESMYSTEESQITDKTESVTSNETGQFYNEDVQIAKCYMNPIGTLQEMSTRYNWTPPFYSCQKLWSRPNEMFEITCQVFHLHTAAIAKTKKAAKHKAAHLMFDLIHTTGIDTLNKFKELAMVAYMKDSDHEENQVQIVSAEKDREFSPNVMSAKYFIPYFTRAISVAANNVYLSEIGSTSLSNMNDDQYFQLQMIYNRLTEEMKQLIMNDDSDLKAIDKLLALSKKLDFHVISVLVDDMFENEQRIESEQKSEYSVLLQVTTVPIFVNVGHGPSIDEATEAAAKTVLDMIKTLLHEAFHQMRFTLLK